MGYIDNFEKKARPFVAAGEALMRGIALPLLRKTVSLIPYPGGTERDAETTAEVVPIRRDSRGTPLQGWADQIESRQPEAPNVDLGDQPLPPTRRFKREQRVPVDRIYD